MIRAKQYYTEEEGEAQRYTELKNVFHWLCVTP